MIARHPAYDQFAPGDFARQNAARKGLLMPVILPLGAGVVFRQSQAECSLDWQTQPKRGIRWVGQNPKPCYLLPYTGGPRTQLYFKAFHRERHGLNTLAMSCNGRPVKVTAGRPWGRPRHWRATYSTVIDLKADAPSVLQFHLNGLQAQSDLQRGIGLGAMSLVAPFAGSSSLVRLRWILAQIILAFQWYRY